MPESDEGRLQLLTTALSTAATHAEQDKTYVSPDLIAAIDVFLSDLPGGPLGYGTRIRTLTQRRAATAKEIDDSDKAEATLATYLRDFWEVLKRRTFRLGYPAAVLNYYDLPQDGTVPPLNTRSDRHLWAEKIAAGEQSAIAAGFPAMANPSAAEVAARLTVAQTEAAQVTPKSAEETEALEAVRALRPRAIELVEDLIAELRHTTRKLEPGTQRDLMRSYGVEFEFLPGETPQTPTSEPPAPSSTPA